MWLFGVRYGSNERGSLSVYGKLSLRAVSQNESLLEELSTSRDKLASSVSAFAKLQEETTQLQLRLKSTNDDLK